MALDELVRQHERLREEAGSAGNADRAAVLRRRVEELEARLAARDEDADAHSRRAQVPRAPPPPPSY
jgi:hypothetical protein